MCIAAAFYLHGDPLPITRHSREAGHFRIKSELSGFAALDRNLPEVDRSGSLGIEQHGSAIGCEPPVENILVIITEKLFFHGPIRGSEPIFRFLAAGNRKSDSVARWEPPWVKARNRRYLPLISTVGIHKLDTRRGACGVLLVSDRFSIG